MRNSYIKVKKLTNESAAKNSLLFDLQKRLKIIADWLKPSKRSDSALNFQQVSQYRRIAGLLKKQIEAVCKDTNKLLASGSLDSVDAGGISLFHCVFDQISDILSGTVYQAQDPVTCFVNLLRSGQLVLNREGYPVLDRELNSLVGMEPWRMMLRHILEAKTSLPETLANIENRGRDTYRYEDYGCAEAIRQALSLDSVDYTDLCKAAAIDAHRSESDFEGEMGLMTSLTHF